MSNLGQPLGDPTLLVTHVVLQHVEESAFLWLLRDAAVRAPHYKLKDLAKLDDRLEAHLDGLRIAGGPGWEVVKDELKLKEPGEVFTAAVLAFEVNDPERIEHALPPEAPPEVPPAVPPEAPSAEVPPEVAPPEVPPEVPAEDVQGATLHEASPEEASSGAGVAGEALKEALELARGVISALGWLSYEQAQPHIQKLVASAHPIRRRIGIAAAAAHRHDPGEGLSGDKRVLLDALLDKAPIVKARALRAAGELGRRDLVSTMQYSLKDPDEACRFWAAWAATILGDSFGIPTLREFAETGDLKGPYAERAAELIARRGPPPEVIAWQKGLASNPAKLRIAAKAAGAIGDPVLMPWILELMKNKDHARVAGEAFSMITGIDIAYDDLETDAPPEFQPGPNDDPLDQDVSMDADEDLAWPDPKLIADWWSKNSSRFTPGTRYLVGQPISDESLAAALKTAKQRQRTAAALELALRHPGQPMFNTRAPAVRQRQLLNISPAHS